MDISVIIPTYKPKEYLFQCLGSLSNQTLSRERFELVVVLNGCKEPYEHLIKDFLKETGLNYQFLQVDFGNVSNARNIGIDAAKGDYIAFIDDDDFVSEVYLEELINKASKDIVALCYPLSFYDGSCNYFEYSISMNYDKVYKKGVQFFTTARKFFSGPVYKLIHKDIIGNRRFDINLKNGEDSLFMFLISDRIKFVDFTTKDAIYYRRIRKGSATTSIGAYDKLVVFLKYHKVLHGVFWSNPLKYNFNFYLTRILATFHAIISG